MNSINEDSINISNLFYKPYINLYKDIDLDLVRKINKTTINLWGILITIKRSLIEKAVKYV